MGCHGVKGSCGCDPLGLGLSFVKLGLGLEFAVGFRVRFRDQGCSSTSSVTTQFVQLVL